MRRSTSIALLLLTALFLVASPALSQTTLTLSGPSTGGPIEADENGRFEFENVPLRQNSVNTFTVTATNGDQEVSQDIQITQLSLDSVVVARVVAEPLPPERVIQLVNDGVIDLDDPENFNVSTFEIVLTIGREEVPISTFISFPPEEPMGFENIPIPRGRASGNGGTPRIQDSEVVIFDQIIEVPDAPPLRLPGVIVIQGNIRTLKEFFSVRLLLMNVSGLFTLSDVSAEISFPNGGLTSVLPESGVVDFLDIEPGNGTAPGQREREFIVRGDEIGRQPIDVDFGGFLTGPGIPEDDPVPFQGRASTSVDVRGPPDFTVRVTNPPEVVSGEIYDLIVEITNTGDAPALFASLDLDVGADANLVACQPVIGDEEPVCEEIEGAETRNLQHLYPGQRVREVFQVLPFTSGTLSSCVGVSDQNIQLQVLVGNIGCVVGQRPADPGAPPGVPVVSVLPFPGATGIGIDSAVTAFFSETMEQGSITTGETGTFRVYRDGELAPGQIRFAELQNGTVAIWQETGATNRLAGNTNYTVVLDDEIRDSDGDNLFNEWISEFRTTDPNDDQDPPMLVLTVEPGVDPLGVIPGQLIRLDAYPTDQGSGVARVELRRQFQDDPEAELEFVDQKAIFADVSEPCLFTIDSSQLEPGTYQFRATAVDNAGNRQDATIAVVILDAVVPVAITLPPDPTEPSPRGISITVAPESTSLNVRNVAYFRDAETEPFATQSLLPYQVMVPTSDLSVGVHTLRAVASDGMGQTAEAIYTFELSESTNRPAVDFGNAVDGLRVVQGSTLLVAATATDDIQVANLELFLDDLASAPLEDAAGAVLIDTTSLSLGTHRVYAIATNLYGIQNDPLDPDSVLLFEVIEEGTGPAPDAPVVSSISIPEDGEATLVGTAPPGSRIELTNTSDGSFVIAWADASGSWTASINAAANDTIDAIVFDPASSPDPSLVTSTLVPTAAGLVAVEITPGSVVLDEIDETEELVATATFDDASTEDVTRSAEFTSSDPTIATVSDAGIVRALATGEVTITATLAGISGMANVIVGAVTLESAAVSPASLAFSALGVTQTITVTGTFTDDSTGPVTGSAFATTNGDVATVDENGVVTPQGDGTAQIIVTPPNGLPAIPVPVSVAAGDPIPTVQFLAPAPGTTAERGDLLVVDVQADDLGGGVASVTLAASGATTFSETRPIAPPQASATQSFSFPVDATAPVGGTITLSLQATDTNGGVSTIATRGVTVVDETAPTATITSPLPAAPVNYGDAVPVSVDIADAVGVTQVQLAVTGPFSALLTEDLGAAPTSGTVGFTVDIPFGLTLPDVSLRAIAIDASGNEGSSIPVVIDVVDADITPPETEVTAASTPGGGSTTAISYQVTSGLEDLDHVELFFRRNGIGTFNRYTDEPGGNPDGEYTPAGATGTIVFDSTRMGGDGDYEFATVGVDVRGNRELLPTDLGDGSFVGDPAGLASFATGTPVTLIDSDLTIDDASFDDQNLRIDGATVTLEGPRSFRNVELVNGAVLTHRDTDRVDEFRLEMSAWTLTIDASSRIDATGLGYEGGRDADEFGRTLGNLDGSADHDGGSHGGLGGDDTASSGDPDGPAPAYGDFTEPLTLGGGGGANGGTDGGDGGGLVLLGLVNLVVDGAVRADGDPGPSARIGMGAGGGINVRTRTVSGLGTIEADGGNRDGANASGGGGGRVAIRYLDLSTYDLGGISARGGNGFYADGSDGTVFLLPEGASNGDLVINGNGPGSPRTDLIIPPGATFDNLVLQNGANVVADGSIDLVGALVLRGASILSHADADERCLVVNAARVEIESGSAIDVTGRGYPGGTDPDEPGTTLDGQVGSSDHQGGSYGGVGGFDSAGGPTVGLRYGDPLEPVHLGSGGGANGGTDGAPGGGCIRIVATDEVVVDGALRADGNNQPSARIGMGSGGSVWVTTGRLAGEGTIEADGGDTNGANGIGGGGGRIKLEVDFVDPVSDLDGLRSVTAFGGDGFYADGSPGTIVIRRATETIGTLIFDAGRPATVPDETGLTPIGPGVAVSTTADTLELDGGVEVMAGALVGLRLNPDLSQAEDFAIASNTTTTVTVVTPNENGIDFASVADAGDLYAGHARFDAVVLRGGAFVEQADPLTVDTTLDLVENAVLTHPRATRSYEPMLDLFVSGTVIVEGGSAMDVTGRGYLGGRESDEPGLTLGNVNGGSDQVGGSHGGLGGDDLARSLDLGVQPTYGSVSDPRDLGSGGGANGGTDGGDGGGRIFLTAAALELDGVLRADGGQGPSARIGMGAGGTVNLDVGLITGTGTIEADGGDRLGGNASGGGGGRIAIRYDTLDLPEANLRAVGGDGFYADGGHGTIYLRGPGESFGRLVIDGFGRLNPQDTAVIPDGLTFDSVILRGGVHVINENGVTVDGTLRLENDATLTHPPGSEAGLQIDVTRLEIDATSAIDVSGRGYRGGRDTNEPGVTLNGQAGSTHHQGGSHGGRGGFDAAGGPTVGLVYGDPFAPTALGSGGGANGGSDGGDGGGAVRIVASEAVVVDGALRADGATGPSTRIGMGAGGSVWITTDALSGTGTIHADGGNRNGGNGIGGGGGRIAIDAQSFDPAVGFNGMRDVHAYGGDGFYGLDGAAGTVVVTVPGDARGQLIVDRGNLTNFPSATELPQIGPGVAVSVGFDTLELDGGRPMLPGALVAARLNPDTSQAEDFAIVANDAATITVETPNENGVAFGAVASAGATYAGHWHFDEVTLRGGALLDVADPLTVDGTLRIEEGSVLSHPVSSPTYEPALDIDAGSVEIDGSSAIDVTARGYLGGRDTSEPGRTIGNVLGSGERDGGSHGGLGGDSPNGGGVVSGAYGSETDPMDLGAGGGAFSSSDGGNGGGRVLLTTGTLTVDGALRADGGVGPTSTQEGLGAGGTVNVTATVVTGTGTIEADGGTRGGSNSSGGGGGRIAIRSDTLAIPTENITANGGDGFYADGEDGTIFLGTP